MASGHRKRKEKAGGTERLEPVYVHYHVQNRGPSGIRGLAQAAQPGALWCPGGVGWGPDYGGLKREGICTHIAE